MAESAPITESQPASGLTRSSESAQHLHQLTTELAETKEQLAFAIAERKRIESELNHAIQSRDEFISIATHELKTPLTSVKLQAGILKRLAQKDSTFEVAPERNLRVIEQMDHQLDRLTRLIDDLLDASRASSGKLTLRFEDLDVGLLLSDVSSRFAIQFQEAKISFKLNTTKGIQIHGDANRLEQVISNLYTNAIRYASGSRLESSAQVVDGEVQIKVQDSGPGISLEAQSRIFARFERADFQNKAAGLGLGLYIAKQIVDGHKGSIRVDSSPGKGATFTIRLPLKPC